MLIDREFRWRNRDENAASVTSNKRSSGPLIDYYLQQFAQLGLAASQLDADFIAEEYLVRQRWGDHPSVLEYQQRFAGQWPTLRPALERVAREFSEAHVKVYHRARPVFSCDLPPFLEIGRQQADEPAPITTLRTDVGQRLVIAPLAELSLSRRHLLCEPCGKKFVRITCLSKKNPIGLPNDERLRCNYTRTFKLPCLLDLGDYAIRVA